MAETASQIGTVPAQQIIDGADTGLFQRRLGGGANSPDDANRFLFQKSFRLPPPDDGKTARFIQIRRNLRQKFVMRKTHRSGQAQFGFHIADKACEEDGRGCAVEAGGAGEVEERFVQAEGFDSGRQPFHHRPDGTGSFHVGGEAGFHDHGLRAEFQGLKHRHGGSHAGDAGDVAAGGNDAAGAAADDDGQVAEGGVVAFLDARVEGVAIHVGDGKLGQFGVGKQSRAPAGGAPAGGGFEYGEAIAAEGGHDFWECRGFWGPRERVCYGGRYHAWDGG